MDGAKRLTNTRASRAAQHAQAGATLMVSRIIDLMVVRVLRSWAELEPLPAGIMSDDLKSPHL